MKITGDTSRVTWFTLLACAGMLLSVDLSAAIRSTPEFTEGATRPVSVAVIPVQSVVVKAKVVQTEELVEESTIFGRHFGAALASLLAEKGYSVRAVSSEDINSDPRLQELVVDANRRFEELNEQIRRGRVKRRIYNAGDQVRLLADYLNVDAIAFSTLQVQAATGGRTAVALLVGLGGMGATFATVSLIDGISGDLEAYMYSAGFGAGYNAIMEDPEGRMADLADNVLDRLPDADPDAREAPTDADVLLDIESLLEEEDAER